LKLRNYVLLGIASLSLGIVAITSQPAQASAAAVPARMRHDWHANKWGESYYLNCHKYHANFYDGAWHTLYYSPAGYNKYNLNPAHHSYDGVSMTYKSAHRVTVLYDTAYLHFTRGSSHEMSPKKVNFRTADNINFFYNSWSPAYLDIHSTGIDLYGSADNAENQNDSVGTFSNVRKQVSAKWINENEQSNVLMLKVNGKVYYSDNKGHDIRPYSAHREKDGIWSSFKPTSKYARLKKSTHVYVGTEWTYENDTDTDLKTYKYNGSHWKFEY